MFGVQSYIGDQPVDDEAYTSLMSSLEQTVSSAQSISDQINNAETQANDNEARVGGITTQVGLYETSMGVLNGMTGLEGIGMVLAVRHINFTTQQINTTNSYLPTYDFYKAQINRYSTTSELLVICDFDYSCNNAVPTYKVQMMLNDDPSAVSQEYDLTVDHTSERISNTIMFKTAPVTTFPGVDIRLRWKRDDPSNSQTGSMTIYGCRFTIYELNP